jgi:cytochrome c oxidase subunit 1
MYTTNHKDIGTMYLWFAGFMFLAGGSMALLIRAELFQPGLQFVDPQFFNSLTTVHGLVMVFGAIMPAFVGFANWLVPMQVGRGRHGLPADEQLELLAADPGRDPADELLPRAGGAAASGWTLYPPLIIQQGISIDMTILAVHILGASSIMGSINIITTILNMRAPG